MATHPMELSLVELQQQLARHYKATASQISVHPLDPSRTVPIDEFFFHLEVIQKKPGKESIPQPVRLPSGKWVLDICPTVTLEKWEDIFNPGMVGESRVILSGKAGYGKSTLLQKIAYASTHHPDRYPLMSSFKLVILIKLKFMKTSCILDAILDQILPKDKHWTKETLQTLLTRLEADTVFLLDGLDEIPSNVRESSEGIYTVENIVHNRVLQQSLVLVATRPHMIDYILSGFSNCAQVQTLGFTMETVDRYIKWHLNESHEAVELSEKIQRQSSLKSLAKIPLLSLFLCLVWKNKSILPEKLTDLFSEFTKVMLKRRSSRSMNTVSNSFEMELGRVALDALLETSGQRLVLEPKEFPSSEEPVLELGLCLGILLKESVSTGLGTMKVVTFIHKSFQEYFAGYYLANMPQDDKENFPRKLQEIKEDNIANMEYLLRFAAGMKKGTAGSILEHMAKMGSRSAVSTVSTDFNSKLHRLARLVLFESESEKLVDSFDSITPLEIQCRDREDLMVLKFYIGSKSTPLDLSVLIFRCRSLEELCLLRDIMQNTNFCLIFPKLPQSLEIHHFFSDKPSEEMKHLAETLESVGESCCSQINLRLTFERMSDFDVTSLSKHLPLVSDRVKELHLSLLGRSLADVIGIAEAVQGCKLCSFRVANTDLVGHVTCLNPIVSPSLKWLSLTQCGPHNKVMEGLMLFCPRGHRKVIVGLVGGEFNKCSLISIKDHFPGLGPFQIVKLTDDEHEIISGPKFTGQTFSFLCTPYHLS